MNFNRAIKTLMAERGIRTKQELATIAGLHVNTISNVMESTGIPLRSLPDIARALRVSPAEIMRRADDNYPCGESSNE